MATEELIGSFDVDNLELETILFQTGHLITIGQERIGAVWYHTLG